MGILIAQLTLYPRGKAVTFEISIDGPKIMKAQPSQLLQWMAEAFRHRLNEFGRDLHCYSPTAYPYGIPDHKQRSPVNFISLSVTGTSCSLNCEHCNGRLLRGMEPALTPEALYERCRQVRDLGAEGVLISGGSDSRGQVPLSRFTEAIAQVKQNLQLKVVVHTGLVSEETAIRLAEAKIDAAMLDVVGDAEVAEKVYHIQDGPRRMRESLDLLDTYRIPAVPHVLVGLNYGKLGGELEALEIISQGTPSAVVIIALSPVRKTPMERVRPPLPQDIGRIMTVARLGMRKVPVLLGCARPMGIHKTKTDMYGILTGVNGIAMISQAGVVFAREKGLKPVFTDVCCSLAYQVIQ